MAEIISEFFTLPVQIALAVVAIILIILYLLSILWVCRDSRQRGANVVLWTIISIIPVAGLVAYCLMRPNLTTIDQDEQDMSLELTQRQLDNYGFCPHCDYPIESDYIICPNCHRQLRNMCPTCHRTLRPEWSVCPYCTTTIRETDKAKSEASKHKAS